MSNQSTGVDEPAVAAEEVPVLEPGALFEANMQALAESNPELAAELGSLVYPGTDDIEYDEGAGFGMAVHGEEDAVLYFADLDDPDKKLKETDDAFSTAYVYAQVGVGDGRLLNRVFELSDQHSPFENTKQPLYVFEPVPELLRAAMMIRDLRVVLSSDRVKLFAGPEALHRFVDYATASLRVRLPNRLVTEKLYENDPFSPSLVQLVDARRAEINRLNEELMLAIEQYYADKGPVYWRKRYNAPGDEPLRVLSIASRYTTYLQYSTRDMLAGFRDIGWETELVVEQENYEIISMAEFSSKVHEFKPDLIFVIDHLRYEYGLTKNVPFVCWVQDSLPNLTGDSGYTAGSLDFNYVFAERMREDYQQFPSFRSTDVGVLPVCVNRDIYRPLPDEEKSIDILYVSNLPDPRETLEPWRTRQIDVGLVLDEAAFVQETNITTDDLSLMYMRLVNVLRTVPFENLSGLLSALGRTRLLDDCIPERLSAYRSLLVEHFGSGFNRFLKDVIFQIKSAPIIRLMEEGYRVDVYGKNWDRLPATKSVARGVVLNGEKLNLLTNQARVCLGNSPGSSFHMRSIEVLSSGAFLLQRKIDTDIAPITRFFEEDVHFGMFRTLDELVACVERYLNDDELRERIAASGCEEVERSWTCAHAAQSVMHDIGKRLQEHADG